MTKENMCYLCGNAFLIGKSSNAIKISKKKKYVFFKPSYTYVIQKSDSYTV